MAIPIMIPRLGWSMEQGVFQGWLKQDGDMIHVGDMIFRLEGEKATEDIECLESGILRIAADGPKEGDTVRVGHLIAHVVQADADKSTPSPLGGEGRGEGGRNVLQKTDVSAGTPYPSPPTPLPQGASGADAADHVSPRARRVATELGVDWTKLKGTGKTGRIRERDVRAAAPTQKSAAKIVPLSTLRRTIAERLTASMRATVPVTLTSTANVTNLINLRQQFKSVNTDSGPIPTLTDFFVKLTAMILERHPALTARWAGDHLVLPEEINVGIAVDTEAGLLVPVIRQASKLSLRQVASQARDLIERARLGRLTSREMEAGVFTVSNLGMFGVDAFTPIINIPECAILGIGRVQRVPVFEGDKVVGCDQVTLSLTFDHRVVDGAPAARFLQALTQTMENPGLWLMP